MEAFMRGLMFRSFYMNSSKANLRAGILPILMILSLSGRAQDSFSVRVLTIDGQVEIQRRPDDQARFETISIRVNDQLRSGDTIVTGRNGRLVIGLSDGSQAVIAPKTTVRIDQLSASPRNLFNLIKGKTRIQIEKLGGRPNPYRVNTPTAVIAVRGTIFDLLVDDDETEVYLHEGEVEVSNRRFPDQPLQILAGQSTRIERLRAPTLPQIFRKGRNDGIFRSSSSRISEGGNPRGSGLPVNDRTAERGRSGGESRSPEQSGRGIPAGERFPIPGGRGGSPGGGGPTGTGRSSGRRP